MSDYYIVNYIQSLTANFLPTKHFFLQVQNPSLPTHAAIAYSKVRWYVFSIVSVCGCLGVSVCQYDNRKSFQMSSWNNLRGKMWSKAFGGFRIWLHSDAQRHDWSYSNNNASPTDVYVVSPPNGGPRGAWWRRSWLHLWYLNATNIVCVLCYYYSAVTNMLIIIIITAQSVSQVTTRRALGGAHACTSDKGVSTAHSLSEKIKPL